jgi:hypothetical protein
MSSLAVGAAQRAAEGESVSGDAFFVSTRGEIVTLAIADGLGHGAEAAVAAVRFCEFARAHDERPLDEILRGAHAALADTRGAAAALLRIDPVAGAAQFVGVGNIEIKADSKHSFAPVCTPGIVGARMKRVVPFSLRLAPGDLLVMHSDGVVGLWDLSPYRRRPPQAVADAVLAGFRLARDDATCVVVRVCTEVIKP